MQANDPHPFQVHSRNWRTNRYVYPVCSRRAGGISIGVNLNLDKRCTFNCVYCQVDRRAPSPPREVDPGVLARELDGMLAAAASGALPAEPEFATLPPRLKAVRDVAFSGDGEPTASSVFPQAVELADRAVRAAALDLPLVLITNATLLDRPAVRAAVDRLHARRGQVWAKLDAGTPEYFRMIERTNVPFDRVVGNIRQTAGRHGVVIQSCFVRLQGRPPADAEIAAWCDRLGEILAAGRIELVQVYTIARRPAEEFVAPLSPAEVDAIVAAARCRHPRLSVAPFYGPP